MTGVSSTDDVYNLLNTLDIPIVRPDMRPRELEDIISDMFFAFRRCSDLSIASCIIEAIRFIAESGYELNDSQKIAFEAMSDEQTRLLFAKQAADMAEESDAALDEFLGNFKIIGGDDP